MSIGPLMAVLASKIEAAARAVPSGKYPPEESGALECEPLKAALWGR